MFLRPSSHPPKADTNKGKNLLQTEKDFCCFLCHFVGNALEVGTSLETGTSGIIDLFIQDYSGFFKIRVSKPSFF